MVKYETLQSHKLSNNLLKQKVDLLRGQAIVNMKKANMKVPEKWTSPHEPYELSKRIAAASIQQELHVERELQITMGTTGAPGDTLGSQTWFSGNKARRLSTAKDNTKKSNYATTKALHKPLSASTFNKMSSSFASLRASQPLRKQSGPAATIITEVPVPATVSAAFKTVGDEEGGGVGDNPQQMRSQS